MYNYWTPPKDDRIWVQNEISADAYLVAPNGFVRLWDSQKPVFYERRTDSTGKPQPLEAYKYERIPTRFDAESKRQATDYTEQLDAIISRIEAIEKGLANNEHNADVEPVQ